MTSGENPKRNGKVQMRWTGFLLLFAPALFSADAMASEETPEQLLQQVSTSYEAALQITWYKPKVSPLSSPGVLTYAYIGRHDDGKRWLRLMALSRREDWVFLEKLHFLVDGTSTDILLNSANDIDTNVVGGGVTEEADVGNQDVLIRKIAAAKEVYISFMGRTRRENYQLTPDDIENFRRIVTLYDWPKLPSAKGKPQDVPEKVKVMPSGVIPPEPAIGEDPKPESPMYAGFGGVPNPKLIESTKVPPKYPERARRAKVEGKVILQCVVQKDGSVGNVTVLQSPGTKYGFDEAAIAAVKQWKYEPALVNGEPVGVYFTVIVEFSLGR